MAGLGWLTRGLDDVPRHDEWLSERELEVLATLRLPKRRADWRLGRWTAKAAVAAWRGVAPDAVEVAAAEDGSPGVTLDGEEACVALSLSHRAGRALAAVGDSPSAVGCDLEAVEPRSPAFLRQWLRPTEQELVGGFEGEARDLVANLFWVAREAASKARREGLRLDVRRAVVEPGTLAQPPGSWARLRVAWDDGTIAGGWWRWEPGWVMVALSDPACESPPAELR